jgi:hypothetical protein
VSIPIRRAFSRSPLLSTNPDVAWEAAAAMAKVLAPLIGYRENGVLPDVDTELSLQSQLAAAELIELYTTAPTEKEAND